MSAALLAGALLSAPNIVTLVGPRRALDQLPQGSAMPAVVYDIDSSPVVPINAAAGPQLMRSRMSVVALGASVADVEAVRSAVREAINLTNGVVAGHRVVSVVRDVETSISRDNDAGVWMGSTDYVLHFYE
jgi:hypothetical protein